MYQLVPLKSSRKMHINARYSVRKKIKLIFIIAKIRSYEEE